MSNRSSDDLELTPELLLRAYTVGVFPMAESRDSEDISWIDPRSRGILPLDNIHISRSLKKTVRKGLFEIRCNSDFSGVIAECAKRTRGRRETWINPQIENAVIELHRMGYAHCVETWYDGELVGGLYGVDLGTVFCGESMFSKVSNTSKLAFIYLVKKLEKENYKLIDCQVYNPHLESLGAGEISREEFLKYLK